MKIGQFFNVIDIVISLHGDTLRRLGVEIWQFLCVTEVITTCVCAWDNSN